MGLREELEIQSNEIAYLNVKICDLVKLNKQYEDRVKELEKNAAKWEERKAELDSFVQSLDAAKKKMNAEKVSKSLELSSTKVELELAKRQVLSSNIRVGIKKISGRQKPKPLVCKCKHNHSRAPKTCFTIGLECLCHF